jgi:hypothetical protein
LGGVGVNPVSMADCAGLWRRTLLVGADGSRDTSTQVRWLQGITAFVDSRGFGGWLSQRADVFEWNHFVSLQPPGPHPDAGRLRWDGGTLVEAGVYADYVEHWQRHSAKVDPCWALTLSSDSGDGLLLRVGDLFGWLERGERVQVVLGAVDGADWLPGAGAVIRPRRAGDELIVEEDGSGTQRRWRVKDSEGCVRL